MILAVTISGIQPCRPGTVGAREEVQIKIGANVIDTDALGFKAEINTSSWLAGILHL